MKIDWNKKYTTIAVYVCLVLAFGALCAFCAFNLGKIWMVIKKILQILNPIIYGFVIAFLLNPMYRFFERKVFKFVSKKKPRVILRRVLALVSAYLVAAILISAFALIVVPQISESFTELQSKMGGYVEKTQEWVEKTLAEARSKHSNNFIFKLINVDDLTAKLKGFISDSYELMNKAVPVITDFLAGIINVVKNIIIGLVISIYFLFSRDMLCAQVKKTMYALFKKESVDRAVRVTRFTSFKFENFVSGKIIDSIVIGLLTFIVLAIFNFPYPALIATIVGVTNVIPFFGPFIGAIPSAFIIFVADPYKVLWFILIILIIQQLDGNVIGPMILGDRIGLSALWIVVSILLMSGFLGITGLFIGVPIFSVIYALFANFIDKRLRNKGLPTLTDDYMIKPFSPKELLARMKAIIRRADADRTADADKEVDVFGGLRIEYFSRNVYVDGELVSLTPKEFELLSFFAHNEHYVFTREQLLSKVWGYDFYGDERTVDTHIKMLRDSLKSYRSYIVTVWGTGYKFETGNAK